MEREYRELPGGLAEMAHIAQSDREIQQLSRVYEVPKTHELAVRVEGMKFIVYPRLKPAYEPKPAPIDVKTFLDALPDTPTTLDSLTQTPPEEPLPDPKELARQEHDLSTREGWGSPDPTAVAADMAELQKKSHPELLTLAAELEVDGVNKNLSKAKIIAAIIEKRHPTAKD